MRILIIGQGAREYALGAKIHKQHPEAKLFFAPGNGATGLLGENTAIPEKETASLLKFSRDEHIDFVVIGPEAPLVDGAADAFLRVGIPAFGPGKAAARLEGSKAYMKAFLDRAGIPTASYAVFTDPDAAKRFARHLRDQNASGSVVLKADGLAAGKGVIIASTDFEIDDAIDDILVRRVFGETGLVVEAFLRGFETSLIAFCDGKTILPLPLVRDHKTISEGGMGPNTGGMGTFAPDIEAELYRKEIHEDILQPFLHQLGAEKIDYRGIVFFGLMITQDGPKVLEINCRFGDPETQALMLLLRSDLLELMQKTATQTLGETEIRTEDLCVVNIVLASKGYPGKYGKGHAISGDVAEDVHIFYGGVDERDGHLVTSGGRVLSVAASARSFDEARRKAYAAAEAIDFEGKVYRSDIGPSLTRVYVRKKHAYDVHAEHYRALIGEQTSLKPTGVAYYKRYDIEGLRPSQIHAIRDTILREVPVDDIFVGEEAIALQKEFGASIVRRYKKGQFDQRKKGLLDTIAAVLPDASVDARCEEVFVFEGIQPADIAVLKKLLINPVDQEEGELLGVPSTLAEGEVSKTYVDIYQGFIHLEEADLRHFHAQHGLAMSLADLQAVQEAFRAEGKDPTDTELSMIDTYWSDHCRHTTFHTELPNPEFEAPQTDRDRAVYETYSTYMDLRTQIGEKKPVTLMNLGTIHAKEMRLAGALEDVEVSDEINACTLIIPAYVDGKEEEYLLFFKNETHNHPTEIEPFGGAQTCLGGAIRDPLSGRGYVYQAMRVTGASDPFSDVDLPGKLPQKKIIRDAMSGYSSYGNQIGLATGLVEEIFHPGYKAKRMEVGAVLGAAPRRLVRRLHPEKGDLIVLLGGRTGRDGIGGATGSSKVHTRASLEKAGAEVQKGDAPTERKIQRLFRREDVAPMIKKCNDFGAGGVSVAIGELADSLDIYLDRIPLKYKGLTPREIAISESQERMAVVVSPGDVQAFLEKAGEENLEATVVAEVTDTGRVRMYYREMTVCDMSREFLNSTGARRTQTVRITSSPVPDMLFQPVHGSGEMGLADALASLDLASRKRLLEHFDFSVGRATVTAPLGGICEATPIQTMVAKLPSKTDDTRTVSFMSYGFLASLSAADPFLGGYYAVATSVAKAVAAGAPLHTIRLSFQEYFERLGEDPEKWQKPFLALLGAFRASRMLHTPPIGGKDSMSGTFEELSVPPTLISFAVGYGDIDRVVSTEWKGAAKLGYLDVPIGRDGLPVENAFHAMLETLEDAVSQGYIRSAYVLDRDSLLTAAFKMSIGNGIGGNLEAPLSDLCAFAPLRILVESKMPLEGWHEIGSTGGEELVVNGEILDRKNLERRYFGALESLYGKGDEQTNFHPAFSAHVTRRMRSVRPVERVTVTIPVFPGTNSEYDSSLAFRRAGADVREIVLRNDTPESLQMSLARLADAIRHSQIFFIPGGFSMSDEPDGSAKFIANVLRSERVRSAIEYLLSEEGNDGLVLGICNGFQALIKTGLLPYGKVTEPKDTDPTLTFNSVGRHIARIVPTRIATQDSPWLAKLDRDATYYVPISHGEGRLVLSDALYQELLERGQIATVYLDNPNGSAFHVEGLLDPSGKIFGKMGHSERVSKDTFRNHGRVEIQDIFAGAMSYFKKEDM